MISAATDTTNEQAVGHRHLAVWFAMLFPSLVTWIYFVALADHSAALQQGAYSVGKTIQFAFPAVWTWWFCRGQFGMPRIGGSLGDWLLGILFGSVVAAAMYAVYRVGLAPQAWFGPVQEAIRAKIAGFGIGSVGTYVALGVFYSLVHSGLEEYYWRWFVFGNMQRLMPWKPALILSSLGFMAHHVILLVMYFGPTSSLAYLFSLGVAVGGAFWAWSYRRSGCIFVPWISHLLVDAGIFWIGYEVAGDLLTAR